MMITDGDTVMVKLSDADWQPGRVLAREVTGHGTPDRTVRFVVRVGWLQVTVNADKVRRAA